MPIAPVWCDLIVEGFNTAWGALLALPQMVPYVMDEEGEYMDELDAIYQVERRDPKVRNDVRAVLDARGI